MVFQGTNFKWKNPRRMHSKDTKIPQAMVSRVLFYNIIVGVQGWHSGENTCLPPVWPWCDSQTQRHMWVELDRSLLCTERFFSGYSSFPRSSKTNINVDLINALIYCFQFTVSPIF